MRSFGYKLFSADSLSFARSKSMVLALFLLSLAGFASNVTAQAPYVLPYTMTSYAGGGASYTIGSTPSLCGSTSYIAIDTAGDGCLAANVPVGIDPHDVRVDAVGNVYYIDNTSSAGVVHKINPYTTLETIYFGNLFGNKICTSPIAPSTKYGDGCPATDGVANSTGLYTLIGKANRGLGLAPDGDLYIADYNGYYPHKIAAATGLMSLVAGTGAAAYTSTLTSIPVSGINQDRGIGADANGNAYFADTADNTIRETIYASQSVTGALSAVNNPPTTQTKLVTTAVPFTSAYLASPEDVQLDSNGNIYIADLGNAVVRAVYQGSGTLPGIVAPVTGNIYTIAGYYSASSVANPYTYPKDGTSPAVPATTVTLGGPRKISLDSHNNLYIADSSGFVVWFVDATTGYIRLIAGSYGQTASATPSYICAAHTDAIGDGCPGPTSSLFDNSNMGTSADTQGNLYITDSEGGTSVSLSRIRKLVSGLNFPTSTVGASVTQTIQIHLAAADTPALANAFTLSAKATDYTLVGTPACTIAADLTDDCLVTVKFTPSQPGYDTATLTVNTLKGATSNFLLTGTATAPAIAFDPGNTAFLATASSVTSVSVVNGGTGYVTAPSVTFSTSGGTTATGTANISGGTVTSITITNPGSGYTSAPTVTIAAPPVGNIPATATASITPVAGGTALASAQKIVLDGAGNAYIVDTGNNRILFYNATSGATTVFAGGATSVCGAKTDDFGDGCPATQATLNSPRGLAIDTTGSVFIADTGNNVIRKVSASGVISLYAGGATTFCVLKSDAFGDNCPGLQSSFSSPTGIAADNLGNLYVTDTGNNLIRRIASNSYVALVAGGGTPCTTSGADGVGDACAAVNTTFNAPTDIVFDATLKNLYVADTGNHRVRKIGLNTAFTVTGANTVSNIQINPVTLVAGNGTASPGTDANSLAINTSLNAPAGIAVGSGGVVYIADTLNNSIRMVTPNGILSTIAGITSATGGTGTIGSAATTTQLTAPTSVAVSPLGTLFILDNGNNRILTDNRSQVSYDFGRVNIPSTSTPIGITELNIGFGSTAAVLPPAPLFTQSPSNTQFSLTAVANSNSSIPACAPGALASGAICNLQATFTPTAQTSQTTTFTQSGTGAAGSTPTITLLGTGAVLTNTSGVLTYTPASPQYGGPLTFTATISAASCNSAAPTCYPTGTVTFIVDGTSSAPINVSGVTPTGTVSFATFSDPGLPVQTHSVSCIYSGDNYYGGDNCTVISVPVAQATTSGALTATPNNAPQFTNVTLTATITYNNGGVTTPVNSGNVTFLVNTVPFVTSGTPFVTGGTPIVVAVGSNGVATLTLSEHLLSNGLPDSSNPNTTLPPGTYTLSCTYTPTTSNFGSSTCTPITFVVAPSPASISLLPRGCSLNVMSISGTITPNEHSDCPTNAGGEVWLNGVVYGTPIVAVAQGSTTDATIFVTATNTVSGTLTYSCSGMPSASICTFSPTSLSLTAGTGIVTPVPFDVTFWTDLQPGSVTAFNTVQPPPAHKHSNIAFALILGWPMTFLGLLGLIKFHRKNSARGLSMLAVLMLMVGSSTLLTSCAGPGAYTPVLTPAGTYPITITVTNGAVKATTVVDFKVTSPGITGQQ